MVPKFPPGKPSGAGFLPGDAFVGGAINLRIGGRRRHRRSAAATPPPPPRPPPPKRAACRRTRFLDYRDRRPATRRPPSHRAAPISRSCRRRSCAPRRYRAAAAITRSGLCGSITIELTACPCSATRSQCPPASVERYSPAADPPADAPSVNGIRPRRRNRDRADAGEPHRVADAGPHLAAIHRLPDAAAGGAHVIHRRVPGHSGRPSCSYRRGKARAAAIACRRKDRGRPFAPIPPRKRPPAVRGDRP